MYFCMERLLLVSCEGSFNDNNILLFLKYIFTLQKNCLFLCLFEINLKLNISRLLEITLKFNTSSYYRSDILFV